MATEICKSRSSVCENRSRKRKASSGSITLRYISINLGTLTFKMKSLRVKYEKKIDENRRLQQELFDIHADTEMLEKQNVIKDILEEKQQTIVKKD